ncbi:MAG: helix-turn-helix domain-containing protein [Acidobacteriota bacterium]
MQNTIEEILTASEAGRVLDKSVQTVRVWADSGKLPSTRTAGGWRLFRRADVERLASEQVNSQ